MIRGSVSPEGIPTIALSVAGGDWAAVVDTGFNGDVSMPLHEIGELNLVPSTPVVVTMANDESQTFETYRGIVIWDGRRLPVRVIAAEGRLLIGTDLLWGNLLSAELTEYGAVTISPLPSSDDSSPGGSPVPVAPE